MYSAALVGTGYTGNRHAAAYQFHEQTRLEGACDINSDKLAEFSEIWNIPTENRFLSWTQLLETHSFDVVSITTPSAHHHNHVIQAAKAGVNIVFCEKPIALSVSDAEEMIQACNKYDCELIINHRRRFSPMYRTVKELIQHEELIGELESVTCRKSRELIRNGTHSLDLLLYIGRSRLKEVSGYLTNKHGIREEVIRSISEKYNDSGGAGMFLLDNGIRAFVDHTSPRNHAHNFYEFVGTEGRLAYEDGEWSYSIVGEELNTDHEFPHEMPHSGHQPAELPVPIPEDDNNFKNAIDHVVGILEGTEENRAPGEEAKHVLEALIALYISHHMDSWVTLPIDSIFKDIEVISW